VASENCKLHLSRRTEIVDHDYHAPFVTKSFRTSESQSKAPHSARPQGAGKFSLLLALHGCRGQVPFHRRRVRSLVCQQKVRCRPTMRLPRFCEWRLYPARPRGPVMDPLPFKATSSCTTISSTGIPSERTARFIDC